MRQEWLDMVEGKLAEHPELLADFKQRITDHDKEFNTSGVPYKGRKRTDEGQEDTGEDEAVFLPSAGTKDAIVADHTFQGESGAHVPHESLNKGNKLYAVGLADGVLGHKEPLGCFQGFVADG